MGGRWNTLAIALALSLLTMLGVPGTRVDAGIAANAGLAAQQFRPRAAAGLSLRVEHFGNHEGLVSPLPFAGIGPSQVGAFFTLESDTWSHRIDIAFGTMGIAASDGFSEGSLGTGRSPDQSQVSLGDASHTTLRRLGTGPWWVGIASSFELEHSEYELGAGAAEGFLYALSASLTGRRDVWLGSNGRLSAELSVPLLAWVARPTFSTVDEERLMAPSDLGHRLRTGAWEGPLDYQTASARVDHHSALAGRIGGRAGVRFGYRRHTAGGHYASARLSFDVSLSWLRRRGEGETR